MEQQLKVEVKLEGNELIIREGQAQVLLPPVKPEKLTINGDFKAVGQFLNGRKSGMTINEHQICQVENAIIYTDKEKLTLALHCNPNNPMATVVTAKAQRSEEILKFGINTEKRWTRNDLVKFVRMNKILFADSEAHGDLLTALMKFQVKTQGGANAESDTRGNKNFGYTKTVESNIPERFMLNVPIIKGENKEFFSVEIGLDETEGTASFWFESPELNELMTKRVEEMFSRELAHCEGFVIVNI